MLSISKKLSPVLSALLLTASLPTAQEPNRNARLGLPSDAKPETASREDCLIAR